MNCLNPSGTSPLIILLKKPASASARFKSCLSFKFNLLAALMYKSRESQLIPVALPLFRCDNDFNTCLGVILNLRLVPPLLVDELEGSALVHPRWREGGWSFRSTCRLLSFINATGACLVMRAFADLKLSRSAASCAERWICTGDSTCCLGVLETTWCALSYNSLILPCLNFRISHW